MKETLEENRYLILIGGIALLPFLLIAFNAYSSYGKWSFLEETLQSTLHQIHDQRRKNAQNEAIAKVYAAPSVRYLELELESLKLMEKEVNTLVNHIEIYPFLANDKQKKRVEMLQGNNRILFNNTSKQTNSLFQETTEQLAAPIQVDQNDLRLILNKLEGVAADNYTPQILITQWVMQRKQTAFNQEFFELQMKLLKREYP